MQFANNPLLASQLKKAKLEFSESHELGALLTEVNKTYGYFESEIKRLKHLLTLCSDNRFDSKKHIKLEIENFSRKTDNIVDNVQEVIFETDVEGNWVYLNPAWEKLTGFKVIDCLGKPFFRYLNYVKPTDRIEMKELLDKDFKTHDKVLEVKTINNNRRWLDISLKMVHDEKGKPKGCIGTIWDITQQKKVEIALTVAKNKEMQANRAKDEFLSTISHEIRTPLNAVIGISHLLLLDKPKKTQLENLNVLKHSSEHLLALVNDILDFGKIESGRIELENTAFNFNNRIESLYTTYGKLAAENKIGFTINQNPDIPEFLIGDATRLSQILTNLVSNAIKFTEEGEVAINIEIMKKTRKSIVLNFEVIDTGIGIPKEKQRKIFDAFSQANSSTTRKFGGTGLGLSISRKLLQIMNSDIAVRSEVGVGSIFSFALEFGTGKKEIIKKSYVKSPTANIALDGLSILVAEDHKVNILMIKKFLKKWNVNVHIAENGKTAVEKCKKNNYDAILMDLQMPIMNGFEATKKIRDFNTEIPIIALSASAAIDVKEEIKAFGMNGHVSKPFNPNILYDILKKIKQMGLEDIKCDFELE